METITRNVRDIHETDLQVLEHLIGVPLRSDQQVIVQVVDIDSGWQKESPNSGEAKLPDWCNVYDGLSNEDIDRLDSAIKHRLNLTRDER
ncbi:MAG: hypothetical protein WCJ35_27435 [Planctomycetota bacterium]